MINTISNNQCTEVANIRSLIAEKELEKERVLQRHKKAKVQRTSDVKRLVELDVKFTQIEIETAKCDSEIQRLQQQLSSMKLEISKKRTVIDQLYVDTITTKKVTELLEERQTTLEAKLKSLNEQLDRMNFYAGDIRAGNHVMKSDVTVKTKRLLQLNEKKFNLRNMTLEEEIKVESAKGRNQESRRRLKEILHELLILKKDNEQISGENSEELQEIQHQQVRHKEFTEERSRLAEKLKEKENSTDLKSEILNNEKLKTDVLSKEISDLKQKLLEQEIIWRHENISSLDVPMTDITFRLSSS